MNRSRRSVLVVAAATAALVAPWPAGAALADAGPVVSTGSRTGPTGPFGFTTVGVPTNNYGEPSLAIAPDGQHVVMSTPGGGGVEYQYSDDNGDTFRRSATAGGGGDSELDFLPNGDLVSADLAIQNSVMRVSHDFGATFAERDTAGIEQDRQWLAHSPDGKTVYLVYHDFAAEVELYARSRDGGKTWPEADGANPINMPSQLAAKPAAASPRPGDEVSLLDQGVNTFSGVILVDNNAKDIYTLYSISDAQSNGNPTAGVPPFGPTRGVVVAHSPDAGASWQNRYAVVADPNLANPGSERINGAIFPWGTVGPDGTVYVFYNSTAGSAGNANYHQYYVYSKDKGATWSAPVKVDGLPISQGSAVYATGAAGRAGVIDVAWYQADNGTPTQDTSVFTPHFAQITGANTGTPKIAEQAVTTVPNHKGGICLQGILCGVGPGSSDRSLLDFFELAINPVTGFAEIAYADNARDPGARDGKRGEVVFAKQTTGPSALGTDVPGQSVPEVPYAGLLPLGGAAVLAGSVWAGRRRRRTA